VGLGVSRVTRDDPAAQVSYDPGTQRLDFALPLFSGGQLTSAELRGTPVVLNFYASWCQLCRQEMPDFERIAEDAGDRVAVIGVNPQSNDNDAAQARLVADSGVRYRTVRDRQDGLLRAFNPTGALPTTVFLGADGVVVRVVNGLLTEGKVARILAADFGVEMQTQTPDRTARRPEPTPKTRE
jgi:cytochrome c biogenesis protein CcmG/thiol:disulfide interchange protein DsbE